MDSVREQEKLEARKMLENAAESHTSGARCVGRLMRYDNTFRTKVVTKIKRPSYAKRPSIMYVAAILSNDVMDNCPFA